MSSPTSQPSEPPSAPTKGERTRTRLKDAARRVLGERGYPAARVTDIAGEAGVSQGTFYLYFRNKREIVLEVMRELLEEGRVAMLSAPRSDDSFEQILAPTRAYVRFLYENPVLVRGLLQAADEDGPFAALWQEATHAWLSRVADALDRYCGHPVIDERSRMLTAYAMNWMVDGVLHSLLGRRDPYLEATVRSPEHLAEALSVLWFRAVYARNPDPGKLTCTHDLLQLRLPELPAA